MMTREVEQGEGALARLYGGMTRMLSMSEDDRAAVRSYAATGWLSASVVDATRSPDAIARSLVKAGAIDPSDPLVVALQDRPEPGEMDHLRRTPTGCAERINAMSAQLGDRQIARDDEIRLAALRRLSEKEGPAAAPRICAAFEKLARSYADRPGVVTAAAKGFSDFAHLSHAMARERTRVQGKMVIGVPTPTSL